MDIQPIKKITARAVPIPGDDIDTDRIIPARFLKCVTFDDLGEQLFYDVRFEEDGKSKNHPIDMDEYKGAQIIISGNNFGCGSSREHAPQSILRAGFNVIIAGSFAEIFFGNSTTLGIVCCELDDAGRKELMEIVKNNPQDEITVDVENEKVTAGGKTFNVSIKPGAKNAFLEGTYDSLGLLVANMDKVADVEASLPYRFK